MQTQTKPQTFREYSEVDAVNWSSLKYMAVSPLEYRYRTTPDAPETDTPAMRLGRALHALLPTREEYDEDWLVYSETAARRGKAWAAFLAANPGKEILTEAEAEVAISMAEAVRAHPKAAPLLDHGERERSMRWIDSSTGILCKGRTDLLNGRLLEFKSTDRRYLEPSAFASHAVRMGYHGQLAFYLDGLAASGYELQDEPTMVVVQSSAPWDVVVYDDISEGFIEEGRAYYRRLLDRLFVCATRDEWPGINPSGRCELSLPAWVSTASSSSITLDGEEVF